MIACDSTPSGPRVAWCEAALAPVADKGLIVIEDNKSAKRTPADAQRKREAAGCFRNRLREDGCLVKCSRSVNETMRALTVPSRRYRTTARETIWGERPRNSLAA